MSKPDNEELLSKVEEYNSVKKYWKKIEKAFKENEAKLRENEALLRLTLENTPIGIVTNFEDGKFRTVNSSFCDIIGYSEIELLGMSIRDITHPDSFNEGEKNRKELLEGKIENFKVTKKYIRKDGETILCITRVGIVRDPSDKLLFTVGEVEDITDKVQMENALRYSERSLDLMINSAPDIIYRLDQDGNIIFINSSIKEYGYTKEELVGKSILEIVHPDDKEKALYRINERRTGDRSTKEFELRLLRKNHNLFIVEDKSVGLKEEAVFLINAEGLYNAFDPEGSGFEGTLGVARDITERKKTEVILEEQRQFFRQVIDINPHYIFAKNRDGKFTLVNKAMAKLYGKNAEDLIGRTEEEFNPVKDEVDHFQRTDREVIEYKKELEFPEEKITDYSGKIRYLRTIKRPIIQKDGSVDQVLGVSVDITDIKKVEDTLKEKEKLFNALIDKSPALIFMKDPDGKYILTNKKFEKVLNRSKEEILYKTDRELFSQEVADRIEKTDRDMLENKLPNESEGVIPLEGKEYTYLTIKFPLIDEDGQVYAICGISTDISERKTSEYALQESEQKFRDLVNLLPQTVFETDLNGNLTFANNYAFELFGYEYKDFEKGLNIFSFIIPEQRELAQKNIFQVIKGERKEISKEYSLIKADGSTVRAIIYSTPVFRNKQPVGLRGILVDIEDRIRTEEALEQSEEKFRLSFKTNPDAISISKMDGIFIEINEGFTSLTGYTEEDVIGKSSIDLNIWDRKQDRELLVNKLKYAGKISNFETVFLNKSGEKRICIMSSSIININDEPHLLSITKDITESKKALEEKHRLERQFHQAQKMESIGRLAGGIAHDFNNILTSIMGYSELLKMKFSDEGTIEGQAASVILKGTERAAHLTKQLLGFARSGKFEQKPLNLNNIIQDTLKVAEKIFEKKIILKEDYQKDLNNIIGDSNQLDQVLTNLFINAKDAMPDGGELFIKTENILINESYEEYYSEMINGDYIKILVKDTGTGISKDNMDHIFEPFYTTKEKGKGTGLGLASVYGIVKNHAGYIYCQSVPGKGTEFSLYFPITDKKSKTEISAVELKEGNETILIVDDEENVRNLGRDILTNLGYNIITAEDGYEAIRIFKDKFKTIDLVILDMIMPKLDGKDTFRELKKIDQDVAVVLSSGYSKKDQSEEIINSGIKGFLQKPFRIHEISEMINKSLN
ncbi:PAS domain S-box protein [candidate division KSB1 bacterium]